MNEPSAGTAAKAYLQGQVANILARRDRELVEAVLSEDASGLDALVQDVLAALQAEVSDPSADYHAYYHEPLPKAREIEAAIRERVMQLR